jgi:hypothetical protein
MKDLIPGFAPDDPIHGYKTLADAEALTLSRVGKAIKAQDADLNAIKPLSEVQGKQVGPKPVAHQIPVPRHADPLAGLRCSVRGCRGAVAGFIISGSYKMPAPRPAQELADEAEAQLADMLYGAIDGNDLELVTKWGLAPEKLAHGLIGPRPDTPGVSAAAAEMVPPADAKPMCLAHFNEATMTSKAAPKPVQPLGLADLDHSSHWRISGGWDALFVTVIDKHGTTARISPADFKAHTGVWPGAA